MCIDVVMMASRRQCRFNEIAIPKPYEQMETIPAGKHTAKRDEFSPHSALERKGYNCLSSFIYTG